MLSRQHPGTGRAVRCQSLSPNNDSACFYWLPALSHRKIRTQKLGQLNLETKGKKNIFGGHFDVFQVNSSWFDQIFKWWEKFNRFDNIFYFFALQKFQKKIIPREIERQFYLKTCGMLGGYLPTLHACSWACWTRSRKVAKPRSAAQHDDTSAQPSAQALASRGEAAQSEGKKKNNWWDFAVLFPFLRDVG